MASSIPSFDPIKSPVAEEGDKAQVVVGGSTEENETSVSQKYGIPSLFSKSIADGGKFFQRQDLNGIFNLISQFQYYLQAGGFQTFDANVSAAIGGYPSGAILFYQNGDKSCFVKSKGNNNTDDFTKDPDNLIDKGAGLASQTWLQVSPSIDDVKSGNKRIVVVDDLPTTYTEGTYYFIRG